MMIVPNWREGWKWLSIQITAVGIALQAAIIAWPDIKDWLGDTVTHCVGLVILAGVALGRFTKQGQS
jgi:hypothetical protein